MLIKNAGGGAIILTIIVKCLFKNQKNTKQIKIPKKEHLYTHLYPI